MTPQIQTLLALVAVLAAAGWLLRRSVKKRQQPGCGGDCGCPASEFKERIREQDKAPELRA